MSYYRKGPFPGGSGVRLGVPALTPIVKQIMIACGVIWLVQLLTSSAIDPVGFLGRHLGVSLNGLLHGEIWQPATYMFLHSANDPFHLLFNMIMLWMFGGELERHWGPRAFLRFYLICGVGAGLIAPLVALFGGNASIPTIGASGAIFGIFAAYGIIFPERTVLFMLIFPMRARTLVMIMFALQSFYLIKAPGGGVSYLAHLGGGLTGLLYLKRVWRVGELFREIRWKIQRRRFKIMRPPDDPDDWVN